MDVRTTPAGPGRALGGSGSATTGAIPQSTIALAPRYTRRPKARARNMLPRRDFSSARPQGSVGRQVANEAGARVPSQCGAAPVAEPDRVWGDPRPAGDPLRRVAGRAVALAVTRDACVQVSHRLPGVMLWAARCRGPLVRRQVKAPTREAIAARSIARNAGAAMTVGAERLLLVAARATWVVLSRGLPVHGEPVVRMHLARSHPTIVTIDTLLLCVAAPAEGAVVPRDGLVALDPIGRVRCTV